MKKTIKQKISIATGVVAVFGIALSPAIAAAQQSANTTINATIASVLTIQTDATVAIGVTPTGSGAASSMDDDVLVTTNDPDGFHLTLADSNTNTDLVNGVVDTILAHSGTFGSPSTLANNRWGYRADSIGSFGSGPTSQQTDQANLAQTWAGVPSSASPQQLKSTSSATAGDTTKVWYGVKVDTSKAAGLYTDQVTYTATAN